ncbi:MAG: hypothetical protein ABIU05_20915 [Nitrospirales bacterium]
MSVISPAKQRSAAANQQHPPRLADLLEEIIAMIQHYIALPHRDLAALIACWIANTYTFECFQYCGYLWLHSATPACGKSQLLRLIGSFAKGAPQPTTFPTAAVLFRSQGQALLLDEVEALRGQDKHTHGDLLAILNEGFRRGGNVKRTVKRRSATEETFEVAEFSVFGPKAFAGTESLADTLVSRVFQIELQRSPQRMPRLIERQMEETFTQIREGLQTWAEAHRAELESAYLKLQSVAELADFDDRFQDIAEPLTVLASLADKEREGGALVLPRLYAGLQFAAGRRKASGREQSLVAFLETAERLLGDSELVFIHTEDLLRECQKHPDLEYLEHGRGLSGLLKNFDLKPDSNGNKRGYKIRKKWLTDWQSRYHPRTDGPDGVDGQRGTRGGTSSFASSSTTTNCIPTPLSKRVSGVSVSGGERDLQEHNSHRRVKRRKRTQAKLPKKNRSTRS